MKKRIPKSPLELSKSDDKYIYTRIKSICHFKKSFTDIILNVNYRIYIYIEKSQLNFNANVARSSKLYMSLLQRIAKMK